MKKLLAVLLTAAVLTPISSSTAAAGISEACQDAIRQVKKAMAEDREPSRKVVRKAHDCLSGQVKGSMATRGSTAAKGPSSDPLCDSIKAVWSYTSFSVTFWRLSQKVHWCWNKRHTRITELQRPTWGWTNPIWLNLWSYDGLVSQDRRDTAAKSYEFVQARFRVTVFWLTEEVLRNSTITVRADGSFVWHDSPLGPYEGTCAGRDPSPQCVGA